MQQLIQDVKTYLLENYGDEKDLLMLQMVATAKPTVKKEPVIAKPLPYKKQEPIFKKEEPIEDEEVLTPPSFIAEKPKISSFPFDESFKALYKKIAPHITLIDTPLKDDIAKQIRLASNKRSDLPEIPILFDHSIQEHLDFLTNLAKAIDAKFGKSSVISIAEFEEKNLWKPLLSHSTIRLIIIPAALLKRSPNLLSLTKEYPGRLLKSVEKIPLLSLSEINSSPTHKKEIWNTLTRFFK